MILDNDNPCDTVYISGACNSNPYSADWGENNLICVAIDEAVAILKPATSDDALGRIEKTYLPHSNRVNVVKWILNLDSNIENGFISAGVNGKATIWIADDCDDYSSKFLLQGHTESITDASAVSLKWQNTSYILAATLSMDTLKLWKKSDRDGEFSCFYTINNPEKGLGVSGLSFALLPNANTFIFASCMKFVDVSLHTCSLHALSDHTVPCFKETAILSGHTNWVNDLSFTTFDDGNSLLLASASHDCTIRIWRISQREHSETELKLRELIVQTGDKQFSVTLCSILHGHDQWIYTVRWKHFDTEEREEDRLKLLSVSADKTAVVWQRDLSLNTWIETHRLGDVGGNVAGFLGGCFDPSGRIVMVHDLVGAFHVWRYDRLTDAWTSAVLPTGHNDAVNDIQWDPKGQFLVSVSSDKTTRLHAPWRANPSYWYEFARPQTHGHSVSCVTVLPLNRFVSGACEKELRSFIAAKNFIQSFKKVSFLEDIDVDKYPHNNAMLPSLDLSNKPSDEIVNINIDSTNSNGVSSIDNNQAIPTEEELARNTLWPEIQKLYYHPNDISCVTSNADGTLLASACKANTPKEAAIAIWSVKWDNIERIQELWFHQLTVTQLAFSPNGQYLLSVSRDRTWHLFKKKAQENIFESMAFVTKTNAIHKRQLHACAWSHDSQYFATGSRDGKMVIWSPLKASAGVVVADSSLNGLSSRYVLTVNDEHICSVSFAPGFVKSDEYLVAVGFGSGKIGLYVWNGVTCRNWLILDKDVAHHKEVTRVAFRPVFGSQNQPHSTQLIQLASAGVDRLVKIYNLNTSLIECS